MSEKRRTGLGRGLGALIPGASSNASRPVDVFFPGPQAEPETSGGVALDTREDEVSNAETSAPDDTAAPATEGADRVESPESDGDHEPAGAAAETTGHEEREVSSPAEPPEEDAAPEAPGGAVADGPPMSTSAAAPAHAEPSEASTVGPEEGPEAGQAPAAASRPIATPAALDPDAPSTNGTTSSAGARAPSPQDAPDDRVAGDDADTDDGLVPVPGATFAEIPIDAIAPNAHQPRHVFDEDDLEELAGSIREVGVLQPVVVRRSGEVDGAPRYELIMGERRWRASRLAGNETVPAIVRETADNDLLRDALLENLHRVQLNPLEEAAAYQQLLEDFGCTHDELASRISRSRPQISNTLRLLKLPPLVQRRVAAGVLSAGHARALLGLSDAAAMERLAQRIVAEGLSVRATEEIVALGEDEPFRPELRRRPRPGEHSAALEDLGRRLSDRWDTKVKIALGQRKGRISIEFASVQDLNRILDAVSPQDSGVLREAADGDSEATGTDG